VFLKHGTIQIDFKTHRLAICVRGNIKHPVQYTKRFALL